MTSPEHCRQNLHPAWTSVQQLRSTRAEKNVHTSGHLPGCLLHKIQERSLQLSLTDVEVHRHRSLNSTKCGVVAHYRNFSPPRKWKKCRNSSSSTLQATVMFIFFRRPAMPCPAPRSSSTLPSTNSPRRHKASSKPQTQPSMQSPVTYTAHNANPRATEKICRNIFLLQFYSVHLLYGSSAKIEHAWKKRQSYTHRPFFSSSSVLNTSAIQTINRWPRNSWQFKKLLIFSFGNRMISTDIAQRNSFAWRNMTKSSFQTILIKIWSDDLRDGVCVIPCVLYAGIDDRANKLRNILFNGHNTIRFMCRACVCARVREREREGERRWREETQIALQPSCVEFITMVNKWPQWFRCPTAWLSAWCSETSVLLWRERERERERECQMQATTTWPKLFHLSLPHTFDHQNARISTRSSSQARYVDCCCAINQSERRDFFSLSNCENSWPCTKQTCFHLAPSLPREGERLKWILWWECQTPQQCLTRQNRVSHWKTHRCLNSVLHGRIESVIDKHTAASTASYTAESSQSLKNTPLPHAQVELYPD